MNDWFKILEANRNGMFNYYFGPSPRFIIGGCQIPIGEPFANETLAKEAMRKMFEEMKAYNKNGLIVDSINCPTVGGAVLRLSDTKWTENSLNYSFEEIWDRYGEEIVNANYNISIGERLVLEKIFSSAP